MGQEFSKHKKGHDDDPILMPKSNSNVCFISYRAPFRFCRSAFLHAIAATSPLLNFEASRNFPNSSSRHNYPTSPGSPPPPPHATNPKLDAARLVAVSQPVLENAFPYFCVLRIDEHAGMESMIPEDEGLSPHAGN